jgi:YesN/AraC family two-component response regulator
MRYFAINLNTAPTYQSSGICEAKENYKHIKRTLYNYELFFVVKGKLYMEQVGVEYCVERGQVLLQAKDEIQSGSRYGGEVSFYWFHFDGEVKIFQTEDEAREFCRKQEKWIFFAEKFAVPFAERIHLLLSQFNASSFDKQMELSRNFLCGALLSELAFEYQKSIETFCADKRFAELIAWVSKNCEKNFSVQELAERFSYNEKYLSTVFKRRAGKSLKEYLTDKRIELAKRILSSDDTPIKAVARMVGYDDEYYFMRVFKAKTGFTPKNYRKAFHGYIYKNN